MRWLFRLLGLIVVLAVLAGVGLFFIPTDRIASLAANQFAQATGRQMTISGGVQATFWPQLGVRTGAVEIANAPWSKAGPMVKAAGLRIGVDPMALLSGRVKIEEVALDAPAILLERNKSGVGNWVLSGASGTSGSADTNATAANSESLPPISIGKATIKGGALTYTDDKSGMKETVTGLDMSLAMPDAAGPAKIALTAVLNGQQVKLDAQIDKAAEVLAGGASPVTLKVLAGNSAIGFSGSADPGHGAAKGTLNASLDDLPALFRAAGLTAPALPQGLGAKRLLIKGALDAKAPGKITLAKAGLTLDDNVLSGQIALDLGGARPVLSASLTGDKLDLSALGGTAAPAEKTASTAPAGWSNAPINASAAGQVDANLSLSATAIDLGRLKLGKTGLKLLMKAGKLSVDIGQMAAYEGNITGRITADVNKGLTVASDLSADNVALQPLLTDLTGFKRLIATGIVKAKLSASGNSVDALMHTLSGSGSMSLGKGELQGLDLVGMLTHLDANYMGPGAKTIFDAISGSFTISGGVLSNDDLAFTSPLLKATGKGTVGVGDRTLDYTVTPTALQGVAGSQGLTVPIKISGSWDAPQYGLDMQSAVGQKLKDGAASEINKVLGGSQTSSDGTGSGSNLKDLAKQGLNSLFGGQ